MHSAHLFSSFKKAQFYYGYTHLPKILENAAVQRRHLSLTYSTHPNILGKQALKSSPNIKSNAHSLQIPGDFI